jgi:hypothetical protein
MITLCVDLNEPHQLADRARETALLSDAVGVKNIFN